jgi:hypothetical protein
MSKYREKTNIYKGRREVYNRSFSKSLQKYNQFGK